MSTNEENKPGLYDGEGYEQEIEGSGKNFLDIYTELWMMRESLQGSGKGTYWLGASIKAVGKELA